MDNQKFQDIVKRLYKIVHELEEMFEGRHFTPDGHMVGSLGECLVKEAFGLTLMTASNRGYDAKTSEGKQVEIKATQSTKVSFRSEPSHAIVIQLQKDGTFEVYFNGPGKLIWQEFKGRNLPSNGQYSITLTRLKKLDESVKDADRIPRVLSNT